jgi:3-deoxy-manno-octulosonate cytidylyltransferase (CMP-KDO synthetase)
VPHAFPGIDDAGSAATMHTSGNADCHVILRGGRGEPNYHASAVADTLARLRAAGLPERVVIDASHDNSGKDHTRQPDVVRDIAAQVAAGNRAIVGVMLESFITSGRQSLVAGQPLTYGQSITDECMGWDTSVETLERIAEAVRAFGGDARMTSAAHQSGTDRLAEVARSLDCEIIVNVQGDEPLVEPAMIDEAVAPFEQDPALLMTTLRRRIDRDADLRNPNVTKVVVDRDGYALYFSRAPIPYTRPGQPDAPAWRHVGLYAYRRACLLRVAALPQTALERAEALEQLRALEQGIRIKAVETMYDSVGVDTAEDLERVRLMIGAPMKA